MNRFRATHPSELSGALLGVPVTARVGDHSTAAGLISAALASMSSSSLTQEAI